MPRIVLPSTPRPGGIRPDFDGFVAAQERLRDYAGQDIRFLVPTDPVWPAGTPLDPETLRPYDPTVIPESGGGFVEVVKRVGLVYRPIHTNVEDPLGDDIRGGFRHGESIALSISETDVTDLVGAIYAVVGGRTFKITSYEDDPGPDTRYIMFAEAR